MRTIFKIAKLELNTMFYSPIAWILLIIFFIQSALIYTFALDMFTTYQETGAKNYLLFLTSKLFTGYRHHPPTLFDTIVGNLYLYLPLITMGLMSRETSSGTIKLLYSSPIRVSQIIFGKYLFMMIYSFILVAILAIFMFLGYFNIDHADMGLLFTALFGIYILLCAYSAVGLFMSCLTSYQVVAALSTFAIFALLEFVGSIWQDVDFVRDLTHSLSISGRVFNIIGGLISTTDLIYFLVIICLFLGLSILKLQSGRQSEGPAVKYAKYASLIILALIIGYLSSRPALTAYYDATRDRSNTLTPNSQKVLQQMGKSPLEVTAYLNLMDNSFFLGTPAKRNEDADRWSQYLRYKPDIKFKYVNYYDSTIDPEVYRMNPGKNLQQLAENFAKSYNMDLKSFKTPDEIRKIVNLQGEKGRWVTELKYNGRTSFLRTFNDIAFFPSETEISTAMKRTMVAVPKIGFLKDEHERSIDKFGPGSLTSLTSDVTYRYALINQGFDVEGISLRNGEIPSDIAMLVIADPQIAFEPAALSKIQKYIVDGGNLLIAAEPGNLALKPIIEPLGVQLMDGMIVQPSKELSPDILLGSIASDAAHFTTLLHRDYNDSMRVAMTGATGLSFSNEGAYLIKLVLYSDQSNSWLKKGVTTMDTADMDYTPEHGDQKASLPTVISLTKNIGGKEQRIIVAGDADFLTLIDMRRQHLDIANSHFNTALFSWLCYGNFPIDTTRPLSKDDHLNISHANVPAVRLILVGIIPLMLLIFSTILLTRRKRK